MGVFKGLDFKVSVFVFLTDDNVMSIVKPKSKSESPVPTVPSPDPKVLTKSENPQNPILWTGLTQ